MSSDPKERASYGRPPKDRQFKPGKSGNPKGRPKRSRNIATEILAELDRKITVREDGREIKLSKAEALAKSLVARALKGEMRAVGMLLSILPEKFAVVPDANQESALEQQEVAILERLIARRLASNAAVEPSAPTSQDNPTETLNQEE